MKREAFVVDHMVTKHSHDRMICGCGGCKCVQHGAEVALRTISVRALPHERSPRTGEYYANVVVTHYDA